jgi:hypothetical protein
VIRRRTRLKRRLIPKRRDPKWVGLFQRSRDRLEGRLEVAADAGNHRNDRERDPGGDQAIFDGGRSRFIFEENYQSPAHATDPRPQRRPQGYLSTSLLFITGKKITASTVFSQKFKGG